MTRTRTLFAMLLALCLGALATSPAHAEGSRDLFPSSYSSSGSRANLEWSSDIYASLLARRTLVWVYAQAGEYILVGSSGMGVGSSDILVFDQNGSNRVTGTVGSENIPATADFKASSQSGKGHITSRALELAGPQSADGTGNTSGWAPAFYQAPDTGLYAVVFWGPSGGSAAASASSPDGVISPLQTSASQGASVAAWDVSVRSGLAATADATGRVFVHYLSLFTGGNGRPLYSTVYACTTDGYQYSISLSGLDPNGFEMYGNQVGFYDSDGASPLYHDVVGTNGQIASILGGCSLALPAYPLFFHTPDTMALAQAGVSTSPVPPSLSAVTFTGNGGSGGNNSRLGQGGTFQFTSHPAAIYDIVISRDGVNFDPTNPSNRRLRGLGADGANTVAWNGKDNSGANFPVGTGYPFHANIHAGEYHFPLLDAENNHDGGPTVTLLNGSNPLGNTTAFYDDRGYRTLGGFNVTSDATPGNSGSASKVGLALGGTNPPSPTDSDPINGGASTTTGAYPTGFRSYGQSGNAGNTNALNTGSFGDTKGLDLWTFFPSATGSSTLNVESTPKVLLVKRITAINGVAQNGFTDDLGTTDDNSPYWPAPASTYLRGALSGAKVQPGDIVEYTVYFACTQGPATDFTLADVVPSNMTFQPDTYTGLTPGDGGAAGAPSGIALALGNATLPTDPTNYLTNGADADRGQFYPPGTSAPAAANPPGYATPLPAASNTTGVVVIKVVTSPTTLPNATGAGTPVGSYGFVRFCAKVN